MNGTNVQTEQFSVMRKGITQHFELAAPSETIFDRYVDKQSGGASEAAAKHWLVKQCVVSPSGDELDKLFARNPMLKHIIALKLLQLAGGDTRIEEGK